MGNPKAALARRARNKRRPQPAREFVCLVGGPCNTFNGYVAYGWKDGSDKVLFLPGAPPRSREDIDFYLNFKPQTIDIKSKPKSEWRRYGWSEEAVKELDRVKWRGSDITTSKTETHDVYWGNFVTPAARLYNDTAPWKAPLKRPLPRVGDIVTFLVYTPPYERRGEVDFEASPYNFIHRTKPDAAKYWKSAYSSSGKPARVKSKKPAWNTEQGRRDEKKRKEANEAAARADKHRALSQEDINFHILMRTTSENTAEFIKRPKSERHYMQHLYDELLDSVQKRGVLTKLLLVRDKQEIITYLSTGAWKGAEITSYNRMVNWDNPSDDEIDAMADPEQENFGFTPPRPVKKDTSGRPLKWTLPWYKAWNSSPMVDRGKVKIHRFDYIGHAQDWTLLLEYGWDNEKGEVTQRNVEMGWEELDKALDKGKVLTPDAHAMLWGCSLADPGGGNTWKNGGWAEYLATYFLGGVVAAKDKTDFAKVITGPGNMPRPIDGVWSEFP